MIVPYQVVVLAATGTGPLAQGSLGFRVEISLTLVEWVLIGPLISALHVHAVAEVREGRDPQVVSIDKQAKQRRLSRGLGGLSGRIAPR